MEGETLILKTKSYEVKFIKPCETDQEKKMAEIHLKIPKPWEFEELCSILKEKFQNVKCSEKLHTIRAEHDRKTLIFNLKGKVTVQKAKNKRDVVKTAEYLSEILNE